MSNDLQNSLNLILAEKTNKIVPENIRAGVTIYNIIGNYVPSSTKPDVMLFDSMENMMNYHNADIGDYATIYANSNAPITATTEFSKCTCPNTVVLPEAFSGNAQLDFRSTGSGWFDCRGQLDSSSFRLDGYGEQGQIRIQYTSRDGITYTRTDWGSEEVDFGTIITFGYPEEWDDAIGYFMQVSSSNFEGLFQYTTNNLYEIAPTQLTATMNDVVSVSFLGKNGAETGNLQNSNVTSLNELREKAQVYSDLSYLGLNENITNMAFMFRGCSNLTSIPSFDTSNVTNMLEMFGGCSNLISVPNFNTSNVTNMYTMFYACTNLTSVPNFDTSNVTSMCSMFMHCTNLTTVPNFDTSNVINMSNMFNCCYNLTSTFNLDTSNVTDTSNMFANCKSLVSLPTMSTNNVTLARGMFGNCHNLTVVTDVYLPNVGNTGTNELFRCCYNLTTVQNIYVPNEQTMESWFAQCNNLVNAPVLNTDNIKSFGGTFWHAVNLTNVPQYNSQKMVSLSMAFTRL